MSHFRPCKTRILLIVLYLVYPRRRYWDEHAEHVHPPANIQYHVTDLPLIYRDTITEFFFFPFHSSKQTFTGVWRFLTKLSIYSMIEFQARLTLFFFSNG